MRLSFCGAGSQQNTSLMTFAERSPVATLGAQPTIFILDDDVAACKSVELLFTSTGIATKSFSSSEDFLGFVQGCHRGCIVTDVRMRGMSGIELQEALVDSRIDLPFIIITANCAVPTVVRAMKAGAVTFLEKPFRDEELWDAVQAALKEDTTRKKQRDRSNDIRFRLAQLSPHERQVMHLLVAGTPNKSIAAQLDVCVRTVEGRRARLLKKMQTGTLVELGRLFAEAALNGDIGQFTAE